VVGLLLAVEMGYRPPLRLHAVIWLPLTVLLALLILPSKRKRSRPSTLLSATIEAADDLS
jgi:Protein of unknown function (DUF983)